VADVVTARSLFGLLVLAQSAHSIEEYAGRLWEVFPPAVFVTGLIAADREVGFLILNVGLNLFGFAAWVWAVTRQRPIVPAVAWFFVVIETVNGVGHPLWSLRRWEYTPGVATAPVLLVLAVLLARELTHE
jgi:hypothetical protein